ncbi:PTS fructose transporter subunit IIBC [Salmonella enterica subsp. enterica serovar Madelia]|nr:PTS fructose transporter subunit IIBC [Salmonella enterica subsp. enterica serovar Madelia]
MPRKKLSVEIKVETNGASGVENAIQPADLVDIAGVIIAADKMSYLIALMVYRLLKYR